MRLYDIVVLVTPDLSDEDATKVAADYKKILTDGGANIVKDEPWGTPPARLPDPAQARGLLPLLAGRGARRRPWPRRERRMGSPTRCCATSRSASTRS